MPGFPMAGMERSTGDLGSVGVLNLIYDTAVFEPPVADTVYAEGLLVGRVAASGKLVPYTSAATHGVGSDTVVGVLPVDVTSNATPDDMNIQFIVEGVVNRSRCSAEGVGALTDVEADALRQTNITSLDVHEMSLLDN